MDNLTAIIISQFLKTKTKYYSRLHEDQIGFIYHPLWTCLLALIAKFECYRIFFQWTYCKFSIKPTLNNCICTDANTHQGFPHHGKEHRMERFFPINQKFGLSPPHYLACTPLLFLPKNMLILSFSCSFGPFWPICPPQADPSWDILDMHACRQIYICNLDFSSPGNILAQQDTISVCHWRITLWFLWTGFWFVTIFTGYSGLFQWLK